MIEHNKISKKKPFFPIIPELRRYLKTQDREKKLPLAYDDLLGYSMGTPLLDKTGTDTLWETAHYEPKREEKLNKSLTYIYVLLKNEGDFSSLEHLRVERIDYCAFGNSNPFRIRIVNNYNDNYDYFYIKKADASRIYGLELEHMLSPNRISYFVNQDTIIEEHIAGIPGDQFLADHLQDKQTNRVRLAKEFVKFNERCFVRLLGDMRAYNWVMDITPDFDDVQYRIRAIDFDQQCYEGRRSMYLPQYFKENMPLVELGMELMNDHTVKQYQAEERSLIARRLILSRYQVKDLIDCMAVDNISSEDKVIQLRSELADFHKEREFESCPNMGEILKMNLKVILKGHVRKLRNF